MLCGYEGIIIEFNIFQILDDDTDDFPTRII